MPIAVGDAALLRQKRRFKRAPATSASHPTPDVFLHRNDFTQDSALLRSVSQY
jgi:hypothetical protein